MPQVFLSIGSNIDRCANICRALDALAQTFGYMRISSVYQSRAVGFIGEDFYNLVVALHTQLAPMEINATLKSIEKTQGRQPQNQVSSRTIDIDLLTYGSYIGTLDGIVFPRQEIFQHAFVLLPLVEIAGEQMCPGSENTFIQLWMQGIAAEKLQRIAFQWRPHLKLPGFFISE